MLPLYPRSLLLLLSLFLSAIFLTGCKKEWLDAKSDKSLVVPSTLSDFQAILDYADIMNGRGASSGTSGVIPALGEIGADNYYINSSYWESSTEIDRNAYIWKKDIFNGMPSNDWNFPYRVVYYANTALDGLNKIERTNNNAAQWDNIRGSALFFRAHMFYQIAQVFAPPYDSATAPQLAGIPLKLSSDINEKPGRADLEASYFRIITDLKDATTLLPQTAILKTRPSRAAAFALLARAYLSMGNYSPALDYADSCLSIYSTLIDYRDYSATASYPFPLYNDETIFFSSLVGGHTIISSTARCKVDTSLYRSYDNHDLRKTLFFKFNSSSDITYKGSYVGSSLLFGGIATDEVYLIKAECLARLGKTQEALKYLNILLEKRWDSSFASIQGGDSDSVLKIILDERRKELPFRALRWTDLRRLNKNTQTETALQRYIENQTYQLLPNSNLYTYPIPDNVISLSGISQNVRN